jgi:hypothetical protein
MDDAAIVRDELDRLFASNLARATAAATAAQERLNEWQRTGASRRDDVIAAWKQAAAQALTVAEAGQDPQAEVDRVDAIRRWAFAHGYWSPDLDLPAEVETALRKAVRTARR